MISIKTLIRGTVKALFPKRVERLVRNARAKRRAMQMMLDIDHALRTRGEGTSHINKVLRPAMRRYDRKLYGQVGAALPWL